MTNKTFSGFIYMALKSRDYVFKMSILKKLTGVLCSVHWYMYWFIRLRAKLSGAAYCYRTCLWRRVFVSVCVCVFVGLLPR